MATIAQHMLHHPAFPKNKPVDSTEELPHIFAYKEIFQA
jgi:hypothetical protein